MIYGKQNELHLQTYGQGGSLRIAQNERPQGNWL